MKKTCDAITSKGEKCRLPAGYQTTHKGVGRCIFHDRRDFVEKIKHDSSFIIIDRNINLINRYIDKLALGQSKIEVKNILRDCISEIALVEKDDVTVTITEQGIHVATFNSTPYDKVLFKEYMKIGNSINEKFEFRAAQISMNDWSNKFKSENQSVTDVPLKPSEKVDDIIDGLKELSKRADDIPRDQSKSQPEEYKNLYFVIFFLLIFGGMSVIFYSVTFGPETVTLMFFIYVVTLLGVHSWAYRKGYSRFPTEEEKQAAREERMRKLSTVFSN